MKTLREFKLGRSKADVWTSNLEKALDDNEMGAADLRNPEEVEEILINMLRGYRIKPKDREKLVQPTVDILVKRGMQQKKAEKAVDMAFET